MPESSMADKTPGGIVDLAIIGGGPTGLFAAFYAGLRQMSVKIIDSLESLGGQLVTLYPEKDIYDVAGFPKVLAKDLAGSLIEQGMQYGAIACLGEQVRTLEFDDAERVFTLATSKAIHRARAILIAAGVGSFSPKKLPLPQMEQFEGNGLHYFVRALDPFKDKAVLIVGGGDSAVDWANMLALLAKQVTLIHRRDGFRAHEDSVARMKSGPTRILTPFELRSIAGNGQVQRAVVYHNVTKQEESLDVEHVLVNIGFDSNLGPIKDWGMEIEGAQIKVDSMMQTSRPGIFAAGDICTFPGKLKLIATGFGEACTAVNFAKHYLDPAANIFPGHSSTMKR
ncbi:MAG: NAD(P)/FAD-dependent oxidoreductase [Tepidisphaeraceae bacterium]